MKTLGIQPKVVVKAGSVSLAEARAAAQVARNGQYGPSKEGKEGSSSWERYLGHFGGTAKRPSSAGKMATASKKVSAKKKGKEVRAKSAWKNFTKSFVTAHWVFMIFPVSRSTPRIACHGSTCHLNSASFSAQSATAILRNAESEQK